jgi:hypothetical protein
MFSSIIVISLSSFSVEKTGRNIFIKNDSEFCTGCGLLLKFDWANEGYVYNIVHFI